VKDQRAGFRFDEQLFRATAGAPDGAAHDRVDEREIHGPSQAAFMHQQAADAPADDMRLDAAAGGFDFG
jgi:hypothetical protein